MRNDRKMYEMPVKQKEFISNVLKRNDMKWSEAIQNEIEQIKTK